MIETSISNKENRNKHIDVFKGILILLVVFQHCWGTDDFIGKWILSFHMSAFFFISGYMQKENNATIRNALKKVRKLIPYQILIGILNVLYYYCICDLLLGDIIEQRWTQYFTTWYLPTYGLTLIFLFGLNDKMNLFRRKNYVILAIFLCTLLAYIFQKTDAIWEYDFLSIRKVPLASVFFWGGGVDFQEGNKNNKNNRET